MTKIWLADKLEVMPIIDDLVARHFPKLTMVHMDSDDSEILVLIREKAAKSKGRVQLVRTRKPQSDLEALGHEYRYVIEISGEHWPHLNTRQREALMFRALCSMQIEEDGMSDPKYNLVDPEVSYYYRELDQYGDWMPRDEDDEEGTVDVTNSSRDPEHLESLFKVQPKVVNDDSAGDYDLGEDSVA